MMMMMMIMHVKCYQNFHNPYCLYHVMSLSLDYHVIDTAVRQWHIHLSACVSVKAGHFGHKIIH